MIVNLRNLSDTQNYASDFINSRGAMIRVRVPPGCTARIRNIDPLFLNQDKNLRNAVFVQRQIEAAFECEPDDLVCFTGKVNLGDLQAALKGQVIAFDAAGVGRLVGPGVDGQVLTADAAEDAGVRFADPTGGGTGGQVSPAVFSAGAIGSDDTARFLDWGENRNLARAVAAPYRLTSGGTARRMYVSMVGAGNGGTVRFVLRRNRSNTALLVDVASTGTTASNLVDTVLLSAGDEVDVAALKPGGSIGASPRNVRVSMEVVS